MLSRTASALIVFEDDARFNEPFEVPQLPLGWDLFYYGGAPLKGIYPPGVPISEAINIPNLPEDVYIFYNHRIHDQLQRGEKIIG